VAFTYLKVKSTKCLYLLPMVLVLLPAVLDLVMLFWSWSWEFGLVYITAGGWASERNLAYKKHHSSILL